MRISELSRECATHIETIRFYEREGLLPEPARSENNYRIYGIAHAQRLSFIRHCRSLDMTLDEMIAREAIRYTLSVNCQVVNELLDAHIGHVAERIEELQQLEQQLRKLRETCLRSQEAVHCGILNELSELARNAPAGLVVKVTCKAPIPAAAATSTRAC